MKNQAQMRHLNDRITPVNHPIPLLFIIAALILTVISQPALAEKDWTEIAVLSTTDMHGKCWETNIMTGQKTEQNMLRVATAVRETRKRYGPENVILIDDGDIFQGTQVSEAHLLQGVRTEEPEAMELCLTEIGYDAIVLGNHEFNFPWRIMRRVYDRLETGGIRVLAANAVYDGTDGVHAKGENAFGTYIIRQVTVNGHPHRIGILGLGNTDITRWDLRDKYPGIQFTHPDNPSFDLAREAERFIGPMRAEGCEIIIVAYHGALAAETAEEPLVFGLNTDNQGLRMIQGTEGIDLMILGHDHSASYSGTFATDQAGRSAAIVNGGGQDLTRTVFRLAEDSDGRLVYEITGTENLLLSAFSPDAALEARIRPYVEFAEAAMDKPVGMLTGDWDGSDDFYTTQTGAMDLIAAAMIETGTERMLEHFAGSGLASLQAATGLDHLDTDASFSSVVNGGFIPAAGPVSMRDIYGLYRFSNELLVIPMYGRDIRTILEENAADHLSCRVLGGKAFFFLKGNRFTNLVSGGINFQCDMGKPAGERIIIEGFSNGRPYRPDALYLVAVNNYNLGNEGCALRRYSEEDALWSQATDGRGDNLQDAIRDCIARKTESEGGVSPEIFPWRWSLLYSGEAAGSTPGERIIARRVNAPKEGHQYILYQESEGYTLLDRVSGNTIAGTAIAARGDNLVGVLPEDALVFTVSITEDGAVRLVDDQGRTLRCGPAGGLFLSEAPTGEQKGKEVSVEITPEEEALCWWKLIPMEAGYCLVSQGAQNDQAIEYYEGRFSTYRRSASTQLLFNFYEIPEK